MYNANMSECNNFDSMELPGAPFADPPPPRSIDAFDTIGESPADAAPPNDVRTLPSGVDNATADSRDLEFTSPRGTGRNIELALTVFCGLFMVAGPLMLLVNALAKWLDPAARFNPAELFFAPLALPIGWLLYRSASPLLWGRSRWRFTPASLEVAERDGPGREETRCFARDEIRAVAVYSNDPENAAQRDAWRLGLLLADGSCPELNLRGRADAVAVGWFAGRLADWADVTVGITPEAPELPNQPPPPFRLWPWDARRRVKWLRRLSRDPGDSHGDSDGGHVCAGQGRSPSPPPQCLGFSLDYHGGDEGLTVLMIAGWLAVAVSVLPAVACLLVASWAPGEMGELESYRPLAWIVGCGMAAVSLILLALLGAAATARTRFLFGPEVLILRRSIFGIGRSRRLARGDLARVELAFEKGRGGPEPAALFHRRDGETIRPLYRTFFIAKGRPDHAAFRWLAKRTAAWAGCPLTLDPNLKTDEDAPPDVEIVNGIVNEITGEIAAKTTAPRSPSPVSATTDFARAREAAGELATLFAVHDADDPELARFLARTLPAEESAPPAPGQGFALAFGRSPQIEALLRGTGFLLMAVGALLGWRLFAETMETAGATGAAEFDPTTFVVAFFLIFWGLAAIVHSFYRRRFFAGQRWVIFEPDRLRLCDSPGWRRGRGVWREIARDTVAGVERYPQPGEKESASWRVLLRDAAGAAHPLPGRGPGRIGFGFARTATIFARLLARWSGAPLLEVELDGKTPYPYGLERLPADSSEVRAMSALMVRDGARPFDPKATVIRTVPGGEITWAGVSFIMAGLILPPILLAALWQIALALRGTSWSWGDLGPTLFILALFGGMTALCVRLYIASRFYRSDESWLVLEPDVLRVRPSRDMALNGGAKRERRISREAVAGVEVYYGKIGGSIISGWHARLRLSDDEDCFLPPLGLPAHLSRRESALWLAERLAFWAGVAVE